MRIAVIGSSTGGPFILETILSQFPRLFAVIIIVQHLPGNFTETFRSHISILTAMKVMIASDNQQISEGEILVAPAGKHLILEKNRIIRFHEGEKLHGVRPAADCTMLSLINRVDDKLAGIVLTGMGQDGANGIVHISNLKGLTIVQDPMTAAIMSMPQSAIETGKVREILSPAEIREALIRFGSGKT